ncbi:MAG: hypothetical protein IJU61_09705 [Victivallales bacterium]|nr:hypothetical protein [Victivallales bacterium]
MSYIVRIINGRRKRIHVFRPPKRRAARGHSALGDALAIIIVFCFVMAFVAMAELWISK